MPAISELCADLAAEQHSLDGVVAGLAPQGWATPTPAAGWDLGDSISHLCYFDETAALAIDDPAAFEAHKSALLQALGAGGTTPDVALGRAVTGAALLERWRASRARFLAVAVAAGASPRPARVPWYGPPMSVASFVSARIMETWAHGADVRDALGVPLEATARLRHICHLGVAARAYSFIAHGQTDPGDPVTVEAHSPDGSTWTWTSPAGAGAGAPGAAGDGVGAPGNVPAAGPTDRIAGPALDLALVFTQRRHRSRTAVTVSGPTAEAWMAVAQAFAGPGTLTDPGR